MDIYRSSADLPVGAKGAAAALGNFDGVHRGHQHVIDLARDAASGHGAPLGIVTFEPHPREVFAPDAPPFRLTNAETRAHRLARLGVERLFELPFDPELMALSPDAFARTILRDGLGLSHVVVGADFRFGKGRAGDAETLVNLGRDLGFGVTIADLLQTDGQEISSTKIREALTDGDVRRAAQMLGHLHRIDGPVIHGEKRGRDLGYPTANMALDRIHLPRFGVYAVDVEVMDGQHVGRYGGVASLGVRPMFGVNTPNLETFVFDFKGDLYGAALSIGLVEFLRGEEKFDSLDALIAQMDADSARAREILSSHG
ncbi:bifunctional riboflavin kinase/FAD synthetase [Palleronia caenipelagi]|uniref:Riboflavin biosynthesis protein n=1 Tax=Palleronia caenipelagi TaxID=2489174 RepID=A0A547PQP2_9RHOB|nr:bifunctional riboflavin kinase/FAD synthetase [Palleronia caenipelagi]TRD16429.1 bifunctional riboflavin kinase/FAD synthetase [Palleronia caenipelagi]